MKKTDRKESPQQPRDAASEITRSRTKKALPVHEPAPSSQEPEHNAFALPVNAEFLKKALRLMADASHLLLSGHGTAEDHCPKGTPESATDKAINAALAATGELLAVSRVYVMLDEKGGRYLRNTHEWVSSDIGPAMASWPLHDYEQDIPSLKPLMAGKDFTAAHTRDMPPDLLRALSMQGVDSVLFAPLVRNEAWVGLVGFDSCGRERLWRDEEVLVLRHLAGIVAAALERRDYLTTHSKLMRIQEVIAEGDMPSEHKQKEIPEVPESSESLQAVERRMIVETLALYNGNRMRAAKHLGLKWASLDRRCKKLGIAVKKGG